MDRRKRRMDPGVLFFVLALLIIDIFVFAGIYQSVRNQWSKLGDDGTNRSSLSFGEAMFYSISTGSLWGPGDILPAGSTTRTWSALQAGLSFAMIATFGIKSLSMYE